MPPKKPNPKPSGKSVTSKVKSGPPTAATKEKKKGPKPIGVREDYRVSVKTRPVGGAQSSSQADRQIDEAAFLEEMGVGPRYFEDDEFRPASLTVEDRTRFQMRLANAGLLDEDDISGIWDDKSVKAYKALLTFANASGLDEREALAQYTQERAKALKAGRGGGRGGRRGRGGGGGVAAATGADIDNVKPRLRKTIDDYAIPMSEDTLTSWASKIANGKVGLDTFEQHVKNYAKNVHQTLAGAIDNGFTVREYVDPYVETMAKTLEIAPESININDAKFNRVINQMDDKGNRVVMSIPEAEQYFRSLPEWKNTKNYQAQRAALDEGLLKTFGMVG